MFNSVFLIFDYVLNSNKCSEDLEVNKQQSNCTLVHHKTNEVIKRKSIRKCTISTSY